MPYDWEQETFNDLMPQSEEEVLPPVPMDSIEDIDEVMDEAERRFEVAQYYKLLLQDNLFQNQTEASDRVEAEIRGFIKERLGVLLGVKSASNNTAGFTPEQVSVLSNFADLGDDAPEMLKALMGRVFKKMDKKAKAVPEAPALKTVKEPVKPALRKVEEPRLRTAPAKKTSEAPAPKQRGRPKSRIPIPEAYKDDPTLKVEGNKIYVQSRNTDGQLLWEKVDNETRPLYKDITPVATPTGHIKPIPMPSGAALEMTMASVASKTLQQTDKGSNLILNQLGAERE